MGHLNADMWSINNELRQKFADGSGTDYNHRGVFTIKQLEALAAIFAEAIRYVYPAVPVAPMDTNAIAEKALELFLNRLTADERPESKG